MATTVYTRTGPEILYQQGDRVLATYAAESRHANLPAQLATVVSKYTRIEGGERYVSIRRDGAEYPESWGTRYLQLA